MSVAKVSISLESTLLDRLDRLVEEKIFSSRSQAVQSAVAEKISTLNADRFAVECSKLDPADEQALADMGLNADVSEWPEY